ncbi:MAG: SIS domain-containing protein [Pseudomonadota bacterium]
MRREIIEIPDAVARLAAPAQQRQIRDLSMRLRRLDPAAIVTVARGSSDHAATYLKYAAEVTLGLPVASVGPSTVTVHSARFRAQGLAALAISQSGSSDDLALLARALGTAGVHVVALTNTPESVLAEACRDVIDIAAGPEQAVAATKSFVSSIVAGLWLIGHWAEDTSLLDALSALPDALATRGETGMLDRALDQLKAAESVVVVGRGAGLGLASEVALKLIETCGVHGAAYSGAEVLHGPRAILSGGFPVLTLSSGAGQGMDQAIEALEQQGAGLVSIPACDTLQHPLVDPLLDMPMLYGFLETLSRARGMSADAPRFLKKETQTL